MKTGARSLALVGFLAAALPAAAVVGACKREDATSSPASNSAPVASPTASVASPAASVSGVVVGIPLAPEKIAKVVNPKGEQPYKGPTGTLRGVVRIKGDPAPTLDFTFPGGCGEAAATHGKLFRVGQDGTLADAMVAVTGYEAYVPPREEAEKLTIHGCALSKRTVVAAFGQRIEVSNLDKIESYMPFLDGAPFRAVMVAMPGGDAVKLYPQEPGHYMIRDQLPKPFLTADVFVVAYATHDVSDLDGRYEIPGIPAGKVRVNAFLPTIDKTVEQEIEIKQGDNTLDLVLEYDKAEIERRRKEAEKNVKPKPPASSSAAPGPKG